MDTGTNCAYTLEQQGMMVYIKYKNQLNLP